MRAMLGPESLNAARPAVLRLEVLERRRDLGEAAREAARQILQTPPDARTHMKRMLNERYGQVDTQTMSWAIWHSPEMSEGMNAFMEKRPPSWVPEDLRDE